MKRLALLLAAALLIAATPYDYEVGPPVGAHAPAFRAKDANAQDRSLRSLMGAKGLVLVFFRSAKWCPYCQAQLMSLREGPAPLAQRGYALAAISYDPPEVLKDFAQRRDIPYTLLSDEGSRTINAWGLRDPQYKAGSFAYGVPQPVIFVISPDGVIRARLAEAGFKTRPPLGAVLATIDALPPH